MLRFTVTDFCQNIWQVGHETPGRETPKKKQRRWDTQKWRKPLTENCGVPSSMAYAPSERKGISK